MQIPFTCKRLLTRLAFEVQRYWAASTSSGELIESLSDSNLNILIRSFNTVFFKTPFLFSCRDYENELVMYIGSAE